MKSNIEENCSAPNTLDHGDTALAFFGLLAVWLLGTSCHQVTGSQLSQSPPRFMVVQNRLTLECYKHRMWVPVSHMVASRFHRDSLKHHGL
jgi:hypothetical protein